MRIGTGIVAGALLLWGWHNDLLLVAVPLATVIELPRWIPNQEVAEVRLLAATIRPRIVGERCLVESFDKVRFCVPNVPFVRDVTRLDPANRQTEVDARRDRIVETGSSRCHEIDGVALGHKHVTASIAPDARLVANAIVVAV